MKIEHVIQQPLGVWFFHMASPFLSWYYLPSVYHVNAAWCGGKTRQHHLDIDRKRIEGKHVAKEQEKDL